jgi:rubrerythrin
MISELHRLRETILSEVEGYQLYQMTSKAQNNEHVKRALEELAEHKQVHAKILHTLYEQLETQELHVLPNLNIQALAQQPQHWRDIEKADLNESISLLDLCREIESRSVRNFLDAVRYTHHPQAKQIYEILLDEERQFQQDLENTYQTVRASWMNHRNYLY